MIQILFAAFAANSARLLGKLNPGRTDGPVGVFAGF